MSIKQQKTINENWAVKETWRVWAKKADFKALSGKLGIDQVAVRVLRNRDLETEEEMRYFLDAGLSKLHDPFLLPDMEKAADILKTKLDEGRSIRVIGDYDVDGITSSYILWRVLSGLHKNGSEGISVEIPDRIGDGYGINERLIRNALDDGIDTIVTCDNGIAANEVISLAKQSGMTVIITDHHEVHFDETDGIRTERLPEADAIVDPKIGTSIYPYLGICGAVVAFKLCQAVMGVDNEMLGRCCDPYLDKTDDAQMKAAGTAPHNIPLPELESLLRECLEMCALATVCDVMELRDENRPIVKYGLKLMEHSQNRGIKALLNIKDLEEKKLTAFHMGFMVGPCLNSSGRLDTAMKGLALLMSDNDTEAFQIAKSVNELNEERKLMTETNVASAIDIIEESDPCKVIVIYLEDCHESLAGLVAGRLRERYSRPVFVLTDSSDKDMIKGSGRSIECYHMSDALHKVEDILVKYGGHAMAAGLTLKRDDLEELKKRLNEDCGLTDEDIVKVTHIDADMPLSYLCKPVIDDLARLEPFGNGNPKPIFGLLGLKVMGEVRVFGKNRNVAKLKLRDSGGKMIEAVYFGEADAFSKEVTGKTINVLYYPGIDDYYGNEKLQITITGYRIC